ncbi:actin filament-associated protein 1-like 2 [Bufo bufo]|uniref:actin filament-associated protein 1-like 2 n=1 Tax=Bufo bufo TaxID=8384 RepID=UPI001ABE70A4|nr:actin filament-associated protein 1-like 2 [Bufo bufo]
METYTALERLLTELEDFLNILDKENLSSAAILKKCLLAEILQMCLKNNSGGDEEYIYMNKVLAPDTDTAMKPESADRTDLPAKDVLTNGVTALHSAPPQKSLPDLPPPKMILEKTQSPKADPVEGYYEEAEPYDASAIEDGEAVSSSYESYDEEEHARGKSAAHQHQWPSTEASIELMKDALICAFLWRKKWLGQWAKQLCVIKDNRLLCYKSSKEQSPQLDISLLGCSVTHKEKQVRKQEHKLKITPTNGDVIVMGMQSREQALQWLKVIQDISGMQSESVLESSLITADNQRPVHIKVQSGELTDRHSAASESGSSTDGPPETHEVKEVKKKGSSGLKLSNLMNLGRKKSASMESPEKTLETSNYLNVLINSHWKSRYCCIKDGQLHFYQDRNKNKVAIQPVSLTGCDIIPQPSPDHLYSFRILHNGEELATLEAKSSEDMGHWLGLLLSESGSKSDPEEFSYDYVDAERVSCIVSAAKNSFFLMQRKYSEPNTYIDNPRNGRSQQDDLYDDVDVSDTMEEEPRAEVQPGVENTYLDLLPAKYCVHDIAMKIVSETPTPSPTPEGANNKEPELKPSKDPEAAGPAPEDVNHRPAEATPDLQVTNSAVSSPLLGKCKVERSKVSSPAIETKLGKNRTEAEARRFTEVKEKLEREREEIRLQLAQLRKERRELKESIATCTDKNLLPVLEEKLKSKEEECKLRENQRVDLELQIVEVKENLRKAEQGPVTLGTAVEPAHLDSPCSVRGNSTAHILDSSPVNAAFSLKSRPLSIMTTGKGTVLQKAKEWEKKGAS